MNMDICFEGIGQITATFRTEGEVQPGMAVALTKEGAVGMGADGALPCGVVLGGVRPDRRRGQGGLQRLRRPGAGVAGPGLRRPGRREGSEHRGAEVPGAGGGYPG